MLAQRGVTAPEKRSYIEEKITYFEGKNRKSSRNPLGILCHMLFLKEHSMESCLKKVCKKMMAQRGVKALEIRSYSK